MQMQPGIDAHIPDGLLAANALLAENSRQGFGAGTHTLNQGFGDAISHTPLGIEGSLYDEGVGSRYTGKERDTESGLDYFGARYYGSNMGRFMSPDPSGIAYSNPTNPQSFNLYSYALNNPLRFIDPTGLTACFYGGQGDTPQNDQDASDYEDVPDQGTCTANGGASLVDNQTVNVNANGDSGNYLSLLDGGGSSQFVQFIPGKACSSALSTAGTNGQAIGRYYNNYRGAVGGAASANGVAPNFLAAVGVRESGMQNIAQPDGQGRGVFQIDLGANPGVTEAQAFNVSFSANFAANMLSTNQQQLAQAHPNLDPAHLAQATAASYNFGTRNIGGNPNTIDVGTTGGNYGSNVMAISGNCF
jgi:RHS repeat-associated protein